MPQVTNIFGPGAQKDMVKAELDKEEKEGLELEVEALSTGDVEASIHTDITKTPKGLGWLKGGTFTAFGKLKEKAAGFRINKKFGGNK